MAKRRLDERSLYHADGKVVRTITLLEFSPKPVASLIPKRKPTVGQMLLLGARMVWNGLWWCMAKGRHVRIAITIEERD